MTPEMEQDTDYKKEDVSANERLARIVLAPKDIDPVTNYPKDTFIGLRQDEEGISFLRLDYMGVDEFCQRGRQRADLYNGRAKKKRYSFIGWMEGIVHEIEALAPGRISIVVNHPGDNPEHVNVEFLKDGDVVRGLVTDAEVLDVLDDLFHYLKYIKV